MSRRDVSPPPAGRRAGDGLLLFAALGFEARPLAAALPAATVVRTGMGPEKARRAVKEAPIGSARAVAVAGYAGGLAPQVRPGDVVVATEVRHPDGAVVACPSAPLLAAALRARGLSVHVGPVVSTAHLVRGAERARLAATGALAVDMESAWVAQGVGTGPFAVVRAIVDADGVGLVSPRAVRAGVTGRRTLRIVGEVLGAWAAATAERTVLLAGPRSFCAGVERAIQVVERALDRFSAPIYVRKQIVHNVHVVRDLERRGAVFVDELDEVPEGATVVFSAHGVAPAVETHAARRGLTVIDATCPLVSKVHAEARRFARRDATVLLIGHAGHEETEGTMGEAPGAMRLIEKLADIDQVDVPDPDNVAYLMQTTLAVDEAESMASRIRERFPSAAGPDSDDICYATSNRQDAVRAIAGDCDVLLVVGSTNSSNSKRLVEVAEREGTPAYLIDDETGISLGWLADARRVGLTAGASAPPVLVERVIAAIAGLGSVERQERVVKEETLVFQLPKEVS